MSRFNTALKNAILDNKLESYVYSYPSKRSYRKLDSISIDYIWNVSHSEPVSLYIHIPFCHYRCTYCTLFLTTRHTSELIQSYVDKICDQLRFYSQYAGHRLVKSIYFGGGTPTVLTAEQFEKIFQTLQRGYRKISDSAEICVECSPDTLSDSLLDTLKKLGVNRISMGIQTMDPSELKGSGRPYPIETTVSAINLIKPRFDNFNLDLIYGLTGQSQESWEKSLEFITAQRPMTLSLYPVVSRPLTTIERQKQIFPERYIDDEEKLNIYDRNVKYLEEKGYRQESFTRFTRLPTDANAYEQEMLDFQGVPTIGIGAGARSNSGKFHYSFDYAVDMKEVGLVIDEFIKLEFSDKTMPQYGVVLTPEEERLRYFLLSLTIGKLSSRSYQRLFKADLYSDYTDILSALESQGCVVSAANGDIELTKKGYKFSNVAAHLLFSQQVKLSEERYAPK